MAVAHVIMPNEVDPLAEKIAAIVLRKIEERRAIEEPMTKAGAAKYLRISVRTLDERIATGKIPTKVIHRNGGTPYFFASELENLLKKNQ